MTGPANADPDLSGSMVRPMVASAVSNRSAWLFAAMAVLAGVGLFATLEARRTDPDLDRTAQRRVDGQAMISPPPPLAIPEEAARSFMPGQVMPISQQPSNMPPPSYYQPPQTSAPEAPLPVRRAARAEIQPDPAPATHYPPPLVQASLQPAMVYQAPPTAGPVAAPVPGQVLSDQRVEAGRLTNPATTVSQGTVIQAVLETALDSNHPGPARAIVSRDVRSFDGTRVLIPRGSRLIGEYKAEAKSGQNRVMIQWVRLIRPDGVVIALDSPSTDQLGRAGVRGKVDTHFWQRFGNAFLQTTLNAGASLATRGIGGDTVILGLPGSSQTVSTQQSEAFRPTIKVPPGAQVTVFVARDLDFTSVERDR